MKRILFVLLVLVSLQPAMAETLDLRGMQGFSTVHRIDLERPGREQRYTLLVREPESYRENPERRYPAVYLLDGGLTFAALGGYYRYLRLGEEVPELFVVGISYGTEDWRQGNARSRDYTAPAAERDFWGGAGEFLTFLLERIVPTVETSFRVDPQRRILFGQSIGGQFVLFAARSAPESFHGLIASNPALHRNLQFFLEPVAAAQPGASRPRLFVSSAAGDEPQFREPAQRWIAHWRAAQQAPWILETRDLVGHGHFSALPEAFRQGLRWIFAVEEKAPVDIER